MSLSEAWSRLNWQSALIVLCLVVSLVIWIAILLQPKKRGATPSGHYYDWRKDAGTGW